MLQGLRGHLVMLPEFTDEETDSGEAGPLGTHSE